MVKRSICVVTATRAEYGLLRWLMREITDDGELLLQLIVTGSHLTTAHGRTIRDIEADGFKVDAKVDMLLASDTELATTKSMALCLLGVAESLQSLRPDLLVVLGDRYELLSICAAAVILRVPIAHISGGDVTEGAIDNQVRHAVTKLAHLHFPGTADSAARIVQMGEAPERVFAVGEPGLDNFVRTKRVDRAALATELGLDAAARWILFTYHPETMGRVDVDVRRATAALEVLNELPNAQVVMTHPNADPGGMQLAEVLDQCRAANPSRFFLFRSLGQERFVNLLREAWCMVGNSSAGLVEAPTVQLPAINLGDRQRGRITPRNVVTVDGSADALRAALSTIASDAFRASLAAESNPYGDGNSSCRIKDVLKRIPLDGLLRKGFHAADRR